MLLRWLHHFCGVTVLGVLAHFFTRPVQADGRGRGVRTVFERAGTDPESANVLGRTRESERESRAQPGSQGRASVSEPLAPAQKAEICAQRAIVEERQRRHGPRASQQKQGF